jgi:hypothetical protein
MLHKYSQEVLIMLNRISIVTIAGLLVCLGIAVPAAQAQAPCSLETMTGTYAFYERGSSSILDPSGQQPFPLHWPGAIAPFTTVGEVAFTPDGLGEGFYWIRIGSLNGGFDPIPVQVEITEMNADCTGKFRYQVNFPNIPSATIEERFIVFDNGREYRSVPTSIEGGVPTLAWIGTGYRIRKPGEPVASCGPQTAHGTYLITAENIIPVDSTSAFTDTILFRLDIAMSGDYTGMLYEKLGPLSVELPVSGKFAVNPDCSFSWDLDLVINDVPATVGIRGVLFNEGKEFYSLAMDEGIASSFAQGVRISPEPDRSGVPPSGRGSASTLDHLKLNRGRPVASGVGDN